MKEQLSKFFGKTDKIDFDEVKFIPLDQIIPNRYQPRTVFDEHKIDELCQTIRTHGVIQPIVVREADDQHYEIIAGERRWRACCKLELESIPAIVKNLNDSQAASVALIENLHREGLTAIEEAIAYQKLMDNHDLTQESLAQRLGKGQSTVANKLRLLHLPPECHEALRSRQITERHARALLALKNTENQKEILHKIITQGLNVKQTEELIEAGLHKKTVKKNKQIRKSHSKDMRLAMNTIKDTVDMIIKSGLIIETEEMEHDDYVEVIIKIPK